jgi:predicted nucleic acid-binding protein
MRYLFDACSIYRMAENSETSNLVQQYTCSLVRYELGNILVKENRIFKRITEEEQQKLLHFIGKALNFMGFISLIGDEEKILEVAMKYNMTFYDASYVYAARKASAILVTEDGKIGKKIGDYIKVVSAAGLKA